MNPDGTLDKNTSMLSGLAADTQEEESVAFGMMQSPGSLLGSSIRSNQVESFDIESESCSVTGETPGWKLGTPWLSNNNKHNGDLREPNIRTHEINRYYGGIMKASGDLSTGPSTPGSTTSSNSRHFPFRKNKKASNLFKNGNDNVNGNSKNTSDGTKAIRNNFKKNSKNGSTTHDKGNASVPITRTKSNSADSIADFDDSEWTPPDSSYGAACPVCGCIPKRVRQTIEMTLIAAMVFFLIYLVVTTSMKIADAHRWEKHADGSSNAAAESYLHGNNYNRTGSGSSSSTNVVTDDDVYVEKYSSNNNDDGTDDGGNGDDAVADDDKYNQKYDNGSDSSSSSSSSGSDNSQSNYDNNGNYYGNYKQNSNSYYKYYNRNKRYYYATDDYNGRRRQLRTSPGRKKNFNSRR